MFRLFKLLTLSVIGTLLICVVSCISQESSIRRRVVVLTGNGHLCSGTQVHTEKGNDYILTAAHCEVLKDANGSILAAVDGGRPIPRKILEVSPVTDLMLLEAMPNLRGLDLGSKLEVHELITTYTHGLGLDTHSAVGEVIQVRKEFIPLAPAFSDEDIAACEAVPKQKVQNFNVGFGIMIPVCGLYIDSMISNVVIDPGSSGGCVVNSSGEFVGVAFAGGQNIALIIPLKDIKAFLLPY